MKPIRLGISISRTTDEQGCKKDDRLATYCPPVSGTTVGTVVASIPLAGIGAEGLAVIDSDPKPIHISLIW